MELEWLLTSQMIFLESLRKISVRNSELEQFSHRPHDAVGDFYLFVQIIEKSLLSPTFQNLPLVDIKFFL